LEISWSEASAAHPRQQVAVQLLNPMAVWRPLLELLPALSWCKFFSSLQARVLIQRVFSNSVATFVASPPPSGVVPGDGEGGREFELSNIDGGEGSDGVFKFLFRVLSVKVEDCVIFSFFLEVLYVTCKPTAPV
jgi:hypothetical protein